MDIKQLQAAPFHLDPAACDWVLRTRDAMDADTRLRQLFNLLSIGTDAAAIATQQAFRAGGVTRMRGGDAAAERAIVAGFNAPAPAPMLVSADIEGSRMSLPDGAEWPNPLALAAIDDVDLTTQVSTMMAVEARARGINWSFTPVLDINAAFRSAIVATRGFGSDPDTIARHALAQMQAFQDAGVASAVKHWPGEGYDDRDQHLLTTINPLDMDQWHATFGRLYSDAIKAGALSVMSAHIALPAYINAHMDDAGVEAYRPASINRLLNETLLRGELGFNGVIVSDATPMAGLGAWSDRKTHLPEIIENGCDMILFSDDPDRDLAWLWDAINDGRLSWDRVDAAVTRILAMKAALGLHAPQQVVQPDTEAAHRLARDVAPRAPTLVKDVQGLLPLSPAKHRRVLVFSSGIVFPFMPYPLPFALPDLLAAQGFEVTMFRPGMAVSRDAYDLILYLSGEETLLTRGRIFLDWLKLTGDFGLSMQRFWHDIPTLLISFGYPYLLYDAPRMPTYINAYSTTETMQAAVCDLLLGNDNWNSNSPVDAFCGLGDARY